MYPSGYTSTNPLIEKVCRLEQRLDVCHVQVFWNAPGVVEIIGLSRGGFSRVLHIDALLPDKCNVN